MPEGKPSVEPGPNVTVAALFVCKSGPYANVEGVDAWTIDRDARLYDEEDPVVSHSPCERWGRFAKGAPAHKRFELGDDGGCFKSGLENVRRVGGVLEHPQGSRAWETFDLPIPSASRRKSAGWTVPDAYGGRSCHVDQGAYGHKAQKPTWLYAVMPSYPELLWNRTWNMLYRIGGAGYHSKRERQRAKAKGETKDWLDLPKSERHLTPPAFRDELLRLARMCAGWKPVPGPRQVVLA